MKILVTGDFQADFQNLDLCQEAWDEINEICKREVLPTVVVAGDLKQVYNPVDARVIKWWINAIAQAKKNGISVIVNLGNHDRLTQYVDSDNWFPILRKAGADCYDQPAVIEYKGTRPGVLALLPFRSSKAQLKADAEYLANQVGDSKNAVLIFHGEVSGAKFNQLGKRSDNAIESDWLFPSRYAYIIGGHIHLQQKIKENIYYCGSPFAQDWGEANQRKGYIITDGRSMEFIPSSIPGWFDPDWPGYYEPTSWKGTRVRLHVECRSSLEYLQKVSAVRSEGNRRYPGAEIHVSASFGRAGEEKVKIRTTDSDEVKIKEYVSQTCPENVEPSKAIKYIASKLGKLEGKWRRTGTGVSFVKAKATNFLSFQEMQLDWSNPGITVVEGINKDRIGKSNGAGKTSTLATLPVALFGTTFKGQKHDRWARRGSDDTASIVITLRDGRNRTIKIQRTRKPSALRLWVDGEEQSSGMKPQDKDGTQGFIEKLTGFTWQTFANAVYIDQAVAHEFLAGTKKSRTEVLSKIQNLERFQKALEDVRKDRSKAEEWARQVAESDSVLQERITGIENKLQSLVYESNKRTQEAWKELEGKRVAKERNDALVKPLITKLEASCSKGLVKFEARQEQARNDEWALAQWKVKRQMVEKQRPSLDIQSQECPTCKQQVDKDHLASVNKKIDGDISKLDKTIAKAKLIYTNSLQEMKMAEGEYDQLQGELNKLKDGAARLDLEYKECQRGYTEFKRREHNESDTRKQINLDLKNALIQRKNLARYTNMHQSELQFFAYCEKALSRDGIPAFLNALLCAPLNIAAEYYSELFSDKALQVRFELDNGEFIPKILNATGGEDIEDQSMGERALAGLIASFALRETAPKCNLLILDEPASGCDESASKQFARALTKLKGKFDSIWITSHNQAILQELENENRLVVIKQNGVSSISIENVRGIEGNGRARARAGARATA